MNECLRELESQDETPLDAVLTQMVRAQLIVEKASVASWYDNVFDPSPSTTSIAGMYARALQADLEAIQAQRPAHLQQDGTSDSCAYRMDAVSLIVLQLLCVHTGITPQ